MFDFFLVVYDASYDPIAFVYDYLNIREKICLKNRVHQTSYDKNRTVYHGLNLNTCGAYCPDTLRKYAFCL